ncbi:hypothetical protein GCM10027275_49320 [Rhabdobacter roseus]|uniref:Outer membrane protein beta-barrel domain-containing protein n=1 Tax=Rhabdobacter roseus TaxID=1655419 RepID=A0A840U0B3_9BACT|nr:hypothetical protein [Rhabdobacter roseus]MBB5286993.1 hypothetical protein [Rhabdobacter roseus]
MADFDENEFDEGFRRVIEGQGAEPPPSAWANIRVAALERQLIRYQSAALWLKGIAGVLAVLLGVTGYLLYQAKSEPTEPLAMATPESKRNTVFITRTERVFVDRPVIRYVERQRPESKSQRLNSDPNPLNSNPNQSTQNNYDRNVTLNNPPDGANKIIGLSNNKKVLDPKQKTADGGQESTRSENLVDRKPDSNLDGKTPAETPAIDGPRGGKGTELATTSAEAEQKAAPINLNLLTAQPLLTSRTLSMPRLRYRLPASLLPKAPKIRIPLSEKLSLSAYVSPDWSKVDVRRDEADAFKYGDEELQAGIVAGIRAGLSLSKKWSLLAGVEFGQNTFDDGNKRLILNAETIDGQTAYFYRTALGTVGIPSDLLSTPVQPGDVVGLEVHEPIQRWVLNLPLSLRYDIWQKQFLLLEKLPLKFTVYGLLGGYAQLPLRQEGVVEIYEDNGREFTGEVKNFRNLRPSYGINLGAGAELGFARHISVFVEPNYSQGLSSVVKDMPLRTSINGFGVKFGARWEFGKK